MASAYVDPEAQAAFARAVAAIEQASTAEVVVAVRPRSSRYLHASLVAGAAVAFATLAALMFVERPFSLLAIWLLPFLVGATAGLAVARLAPLERLLVPASLAAHHVRVGARATFVERGVHHTRSRCGLLVYVSLLEQRVALVADSGLAAALTQAELAAFEATLAAAVPRGAAALAAALAGLAEPLAAASPRHRDDHNELPDEVHA